MRLRYRKSRFVSACIFDLYGSGRRRRYQSTYFEFSGIGKVDVADNLRRIVNVIFHCYGINSATPVDACIFCGRSYRIYSRLCHFKREYLFDGSRHDVDVGNFIEYSDIVAFLVSCRNVSSACIYKSDGRFVFRTG